MTSYLLSFEDGRDTIPYASLPDALRAALAEDTDQAWTIGERSDASIVVLASRLDGTPHISQAGLEILELAGEAELAAGLAVGY